MHTHTKAALVITIALALVFVTPVAAQGAEDDTPAPCAGEGVSGTVVAVDEATGTVTVDTGDGLCTVLLDGEYDHPIVTLLGQYFGDVNAEALAAALDTTQGCAVQDPRDLSWSWADCDAVGAVEITVTGENDDGTFTFTAIVDGLEITGTVTVEDSSTAADLSEALEILMVEWNLDEDGVLIQVGDQIAAYHEDGMGFGVLVKLYAIAAASQEACADLEDGEEPCGVTVEELVEAFESGMGMGELFAEYGKPALLGVGHVRQALRGRPDRLSRWEQARRSQQLRLTAQTPDDAGKPDQAGPKPKATKDTGKPDDAGPKPKPTHDTGKPDHAGPKPKADDTGKPDHAGPKNKEK